MILITSGTKPATEKTDEIFINNLEKTSIHKCTKINSFADILTIASPFQLMFNFIVYTQQNKNYSIHSMYQQSAQYIMKKTINLIFVEIRK